MKATALLAGIALLLCSCNRKPSAAGPPTPIEGEQSARVPPAPAPSVKVAATKEQIGSCVGVRVIAGALPVVNVTGAILHRQELPADEPFFDQHRCVVALIKGWTEAQLKSDQATIHIFRNLPDERGQPGAHAYRGTLLQFDEKTGIALFTYSQGFSAATEVGFKIDRETSAPFKAIALRYGSADPAEEAVMLSRRGRASARTLQPIPVDEGQMEIATKNGGKLAFPPRDPAPGSDGVLIATGSASLIGFASETGAGAGTAELVRIPSLQIAVQIPAIVPISSTFEHDRLNHVKMSLSVERKNGAESLTRVWVRRAVVASSTEVDLKSLAEPYPSIGTIHDFNLFDRHQADSGITGNLPLPRQPNGEVIYLVQVSWALTDEEERPSINSRPFLVKLANRNGGIVATTEGIAGPSAPTPEQEAQTATFKIEAPVVRIFEIAEGKEVLMQLHGDPHWKRFSIEKKTWLPLPPINLSTVDLTGNRSSLIVLDRAAGEVRRYQLSDLTLAATARLSMPGEEILTLRAGCLSDQAPIHVLCSGGPVSLDATTLQRIDDSDARSPRGLNAETAGNFYATGDGTSLISRDAFLSTLTFRGDVLGLRPDFFDTASRRSRGGAMVSAAFDIEKQTVSTCAAPGGTWKRLMELGSLDGKSRMFTFPNAPIVGRLIAGNAQTIPPKPAQMELFSLWHAAPFAAVPAPELDSLVSPYSPPGEPKHLVFVDLHSRRLGILSHDQTTWSVRDFEPPGDMGRTILLNWPETTVKRGGDFRFVPLLLGEARFSAEVLGVREPTPVTIDDKGITFRVAENELASLLVLNLTITGEKSIEVASIPIHVGGVPLPFIWPDLNPGINADDFGNGFKSLIASKDLRVPVKTHLYKSPDPVEEILTPTNDIVAFVTGANRVDLFSLSSRKIVGSIRSTATAKYYAGCDALFEYDTNTRTLTRITIPEGKRGAHISLPENMNIDAIALGSQRDHPVSLFLNKRHNERFAEIGPWKYTTWQNTRGLAVVNSETLQSGGFMQPSVWTEAATREAATMAIYPGVSKQIPVKIASSQNGSILHLARHFAVILPRFAIVAPYPENSTHSGLYWHYPRAEGSITGITATSGGAISRNGLLEDNRSGVLGTPCGRYTLVKGDVNLGGGGSFEVRSLENGQPIFRLNRLAVLRADPDAKPTAVESSIQVLGEKGPAVIKSRGQTLLQFVDFDIPRLAAQAAPDHFHVISQPPPLVMEGAIYEYLVKVNNPDLVKSFRLRHSPPATTISPSGLLRLVAPQGVRLTERVPVSIEIETTTGSTVLHSFSIIALAKKLNPSPPLPPRSTPPATPPGQNPQTL